MKRIHCRDIFQETYIKVVCVLLAALLAIGGIASYQLASVPELVSYIDTDGSVTIEEDEVPLANTKTTTSTKTSTSTKKVKLSSKAKKTYTSKGKATTKTTTKTSTKTSKTASKVTTTKTTTKTAVKTQVTKKYTKNSNICKQTTTTKTTVTKTVSTSTAKISASTSSLTATSASSTSSTLTTAKALATVDSRVASAWNTLGFSFKIDSSVSYSGYFSAENRTITLKTLDETIYHELGHFVAFVAGNIDTSSAFNAIYNAEKSLYTKYNASYVTQTASEYFAESFKEYTLDAATLKSERPQTYAAIVSALDKLTDAQVKKIATVYSSIWS